MKFNWTDEMNAYIVVKRTAYEWTWARIATGFNAKFQTKKNANALSMHFKTLILKQPYTQEEIDYIHGCFLNSLGQKKTKQGFKELFGRTINAKQVEWVIKNCTPINERLQIEKAVQNQVEDLKNKLKNNMVNNMKTRKSRKGITPKKWTAEEHEGLFSITSGKKLKDYSKRTGRSEGSIKQRMSNFKINMTNNKNKVSKNGFRKGRMTKIELEMIRNCKTVEEALALDLRKPETIIRQFAVFNTLENPPVKPVEKKQAKNYYRLWTAEETAQLMKCKTRNEVIILARKINRSEQSAHQKWFVAKETEGAVKEMVSKVSTLKKKALDVPKKTTKTEKKYAPRWTEEEDFDLVCNFYELSIDQARNKFNRSYGAIATRLEKLVDSTQPKHEEMLMKAAVLIKARKQAESKPVKLSRGERRKARKQAKLAKRIAEMKAKMQG